MIILAVFFFILFLLSIFFIHESLRYHYEYSQWKELTYEIKSLFKIDENFPVNFKTIMDYEVFRLEENKKKKIKIIMIKKKIKTRN